MYRVVAKHDGQAWTVKIEDESGALVGGTRTTGLDEIDERARGVIAGYIGAKPDEVALAIDIQLDPAVEYRLDRIERLRREADSEVHAVQRELTHAGVSLGDIAALLADTITNREIAAHGLRRYPHAVAIRFDDRGRFATTTCRACLDRDKASYAELPAEDANTLLFRGPLMCDVCFEDIG
jgi:hypothetical protein